MKRWQPWVLILAGCWHASAAAVHSNVANPATLLIAHASEQAPNLGADDAQAPQLRPLPTLQRMVRHFDFEEAEQTPHTMPLNFYRYGGEEGAAAQGFPPFGTMKLTNAAAYSGHWSFAFELDGGSLAARVPTAVLPVVPLADYAVTAQIRTADLTRARARLVAWLHDAQGNIIDDSRVMSELIDTAGQWEAHSVLIRGDYEHAADLVIELQLLQPRQFATAEPDHEIMLDDIGAKAWFDDVTVWHVPRVELSTSQPGNVIEAADDSRAAELTVLVRDLAHEKLNARLRIFDIHGEQVHDELFPAPRMPRPRTVTLPELRYGWYRAVLELLNGSDSNKLVARRWVNFAVLAPSQRPFSRLDRRFGVVLNDDWLQQGDELEVILERLGVGSVVLPVWTRSGPHLSLDRSEALKPMLSRLAARSPHLTMALETVPDELAVALDASRDDVLAAFARHDPAMAAWRDALAPLAAVGSEMQQWQLGTARTPTAVYHQNLQQLVADASDAVMEIAGSPRVAVPLAAEHALGNALDFPERVIAVSHEIQPEEIGTYASLWQRHASPYAVHLQRPGPAEGVYSEHERSLDLFFRALHTVRAGINVMHIDAPWRVDDEGECSPDPALVIWHQLAEHLRSRRFVGEMQFEQGRCWLFKGEVAGDDALVAWSLRDAGDELVMQVADHAVQVVDMFGNSETVELTGTSPGEHHIALSRSPVFIEGINLPLVHFRSGFALQPAFLPAEHRAHQHEIVLHNPWDMPLSGTLQIHDQPYWHITPRSHDFSIPPRGEIRLPVEIILERNIIAGEKALRAEVNLQAEGRYRLALSAPVQVGLPHLDFSTAWRIVTNAETGRDDIVVTQYIMNTAPPGSEPVHADATLRANGVRQHRRIVSGLEPGAMVIRMFHIPDGASLLAGRTILMSLTDRNGLGRLNHELRIPSFTATPQTANVEPTH